jgi:hypothetical protein
MQVRYVGPASGGVTIADTGQHCDLNGVVEVYDKLGASLLEQGIWEPVTKSKATAKAAADKEK